MRRQRDVDVVATSFQYEAHLRQEMQIDAFAGNRAGANGPAVVDRIDGGRLEIDPGGASACFLDSSQALRL
jgi:hypothetical protein